MKNLLLFAITVIFINSFCFGQISYILKITDTNGYDITNGVMTVTGHIDSTYVFAYAYVTNNSSSTISVKVRRTEISLVTGQENVFCWGSCFLPWIDESPNGLPIAAGATNEHDFHGQYASQGNAGSSIIAYTFFDENDTNVSSMVTVTFDVSTGVNEITENNHYFSKPYPMPANSYTSFTYNINKQTNCYIKIYNILGKEVETKHIDNTKGELRINTSFLDSGIYFYTIIVDNKLLKTDKIVVSH